MGVGVHIDEDMPDPECIGEDLSDGAQYYDQYTGLLLSKAGVVKARKDEIAFAKTLEAFEPRPRAEAIRKMGRPPFGTRWIDSNKGDSESPDLRSRLVVLETRRTSTIDIEDIASVTSSTPPLEVVRLFMSLMMSLKGPKGEPLVLQFLDVSRAHPHCDVLRDDFYVEAPAEWGAPADTCLLVRKCWYGMRDAGQAFEFAVRDRFVSQGFEQGMFSPCVYKFAKDGEWFIYFIHGDDYDGLGARMLLERYKAALDTRFIIKCRGYLGGGAGCCSQIRMLIRILTCVAGHTENDDMLTYEADSRHIDLLGAAYGLSQESKSRVTPWNKKEFLDRNPLAGPELAADKCKAFRSNCMRALYLAIDRPDIQFCSKEIARSMATPTVYADETLKGMARFLVGTPRVVWRFPRQAWPGTILGQYDANWAACLITRKSSSA